jgi:outer membrane protein TolC
MRRTDALRWLWVAVVLVFVLVQPLVAQAPDTVLTLTGAQSLLQQYNPNYRSALASADATGEGVWSAWGAILPSVTANVNFGRNEFTTRTFVDPTGSAQELENPLTSITKQASAGLLFNWQVFDGGSKIFNIGASNASARAANWGAVARLVQLRSQMESQYFEALKQQQLSRLARILLVARQRDLEVTQARFRIASAQQTDVLQAEVQVGQNELAVLRAEQAAEAAKRELSTLIGLEEEIDYDLRDTAIVFDPTRLQPAALVNAARASSPELQRLEEEITAANKRLWSARGTWWPSVSISLNLTRSEVQGSTGDIFNTDPRNSGNDLRFSLNWPLLAGFEKKWRTGQESARVQEARQNKVAGILETDKNVRTAYEALVAAYQAVQLQTRNVELARESVRLATERYRIGAISYIELQNATSQATEAERGLIEARFDFMQNFARLQGAVGRPIEIPQQ